LVSFEEIQAAYHITLFTVQLAARSLKVNLI